MTSAEFFVPADLQNALEVLGRNESVKILAGGTDLWPKWTSEGNKPQRVLSLHSIKELRAIDEEEGELRIGATCTHADLIRSDLVQKACPGLVQAASEVGAIQIQNRGTIGGNLSNASPAADLPPPLVAAGAKVELASTKGTRIVPLNLFFTGYRTLDLRSDELLTAVLVPFLPQGAKEFFRKVGTRKAQAISKVVGSCRLQTNPDGTIASVGIAFGSVGPTVIRMYDLEKWLTGRAAGPETASEAAELAEKRVQPIDDLRSSAEYRRHVVGRLVYSWIV
ncbi:MAG: xanthine dehydrogenase family protein subunit M [Pseudomonadota bacterium]